MSIKNWVSHKYYASPMYILFHNAFSIITVTKYNVIFVEKMMKFDSKIALG